jgi:pimeloyl-ACP methyl ester carboxylesterase
MKRGITILLSLSVLLTVAYFTASKWAIKHETISFYDRARDNRLVAVDVAVRRDKELQADAGMITLPVAILNHGNTVKSSEYSFLANAFAFRGYLVISPQHDLPTDPPMVTKVGELYVGRLPQILRGVANIQFAIEEMKKVQPHADYARVTMVGHSMGGDISMYFAKQHPDEIKKVVTLDNLRVPFLTDGKFKILDPVDARQVPRRVRQERRVEAGVDHRDARLLALFGARNDARVRLELVILGAERQDLELAFGQEGHAQIVQRHDLLHLVRMLLGEVHRDVATHRMSDHRQMIVVRVGLNLHHLVNGKMDIG